MAVHISGAARIRKFISGLRKKKRGQSGHRSVHKSLLTRR